MKTRRFLGWSGVALAVLLLATGGEMYWRFLAEKKQGLSLMEQGRRALAAQDFAKAIASFDAALTKPLETKAKAEIYAQRGQARNLAGHSEGAVADLAQALQLDSGLGEAYAERARIYQASGEKEKAIEDYGAAIAHGSSGPDNYSARGTLLLESGQPEKAAADFAEVVQRAPDDVGAFIKCARAYVAANNANAAIASYSSALALEPNNQEAHAERGDLYSRTGDVAKAMADYAELRTAAGETLAKKVNQTPVVEGGSRVTELLRQAAIQQASGQLDEALHSLNQLLQMDVDLVVASTALQNRGNIYHQQGDNERALRDYNQAIRFNPANAGAYVNRGLIYDIKKDSEAALMDYNEALRFNPKMYEALFDRALLLRDEGDSAGAERDLTAALQISEKPAWAYLNRAYVYQMQGRLDQAMADTQSAIKAEPKMAEAYLGRARLFSKKRIYARALKDFGKAAELNPEARSTAFNGMAWIRATCPEKSVRDGKKAVEEALQACVLTSWNQGGIVDTLAAAYAENGEFEKAANFEMYALTLPGMGPENQGDAEKRVRLYQSRQPYRDSAVD